MSIDHPTYEELEMKLSWIYQMLSNASLPTALRIVTITLKKNIRPEDGLTAIFLPNIAREAGLSTKTVSSAIKQLAKSGIIKRDCKGKRLGPGDFKKTLSVAVPELSQPDRLELLEPRYKGGSSKRVFCPECGERNMLVRKSLICPCGHSEILSEHRVCPPEECYNCSNVDQELWRLHGSHWECMCCHVLV